jgi:hypothetical protein
MIYRFDLDYFKTMVEILAKDMESGRNSECPKSKLNDIWIWRAYDLCIRTLSIPRFSKEQSLEWECLIEYLERRSQDVSVSWDTFSTTFLLHRQM